MIQIDHIGISARDALSSARRLAEILGAPEPSVDGADDDMYRVEVGHGKKGWKIKGGLWSGEGIYTDDGKIVTWWD